MERKYYINKIPYNSASERLDALRTSIPALENHTPINNGHIYSQRKEIIAPTSSKRFRDAISGFFGWVVFGNIAFLLFFFQFIEGSVIIYGDLFTRIIWLFTIISMLILLLNKKYWVSIGVATALLLNVLLWIILPTLDNFYQLSEASGLSFYEVSTIIIGNYHGFDLSNIILFGGIPLPLGVLIVFC